MKLIDEILTKLIPYQDKVALYPLNNQEIEIIKSKFTKSIPEYFLYFLSKVGIYQDFVPNILDNIYDFEDLSDFLESDDFFRFGHDGGGEDYWLLKFDNENDRNLYEFEFYNSGEIISLGKTFDVLLNESLQYVIDNYDNLSHNNEKHWQVEFSVKTNDVQLFVKEISVFISVTLLQEPTPSGKSEFGIEYDDGTIEIEGFTIPLSKSSSINPDEEELYFSIDEPVDSMLNDSKIKKIKQGLDRCSFSYLMISLGIIYW